MNQIACGTYGVSWRGRPARIKLSAPENRPPDEANMTSIPLYQSPATPDAWHRVSAPGGYEWWYFDAEDLATDTQVVAIFLEGFVFHPGYLRAFARFVKNPTRTPPPLPGDWPCVYLCIYRGGKILHQFMTQYGTQAFHASADAVDVAIGPNRFLRAGDVLKLQLSGSPWKLTWQGPKTATDQTLSATFDFTPRYAHAAAERVFLSRAMTGADHHWVIANPSCDVAGSITLTKPGGDEAIAFNGRGYHDHNYGTGPLGPGLQRWIWGRALLGDRVLTFHYAKPQDASLADEIHLMRADADAFAEVPVRAVTADWSGRTALGLAYPKQIAFDDAFQLTSPRVIDLAPFYMRLQYTVSGTLVGSATNATAFCEIAYPHRLRWPILGRMIEMSIDKRGMR
jgi:carotenoid 1,2-hydratase